MSTNREWINQLSDERIAEMLISYTEEPDWDYDYDDNLYQCGYTDVFVTSDGERYTSFDEAIEHEVRWLNQEHLEET